MSIASAAPAGARGGRRHQLCHAGGPGRIAHAGAIHRPRHRPQAGGGFQLFGRGAAGQPAEANVISNGDRIKAGRSSLVIPLHRNVRGSRDIISGQARPAAGGGRRRAMR